MNNYRPISNIPFISKLLENVVVSRLVEHLSKNNLMEEYQSAYRADHSTGPALLKVHHDIQGWWQHRDCTAQGPPWYTGLMTAQRLHCSRSTMIYRADDRTETALLKVHHDIHGWWQHRDCTAQGPPWYTGLMTAQILHCSRSTMTYRADDRTETALLKVHHDIQGWWQHRDCTAQGPPWYTGLMTGQRLHCSKSTMIYRADDSTETALLKVHHDMQGWSRHRDCTAQCPPWYTGLMTAQTLHCSRSTMTYRADDSTETALLKVPNDIQGWWQHRDCTAQGTPWCTGLMTAQRLHCSRSTMIYRADDSTETALLKVHHDIQGWWEHSDCTAQGPPWYTGLMTAQRLHCSRSTMIYRADDSTETALLKVHRDIQGWWQHRDCTAQGPPWYTGLMTAQRRHCARSTMIYRADDSTETALLKVHHDIQGWWQHRYCTAQVKVHHDIQGWWQHRDCTAQGPPWYTGLVTAQRRLHCSRSTMIYRADHSTETALLKVHHDIQGWWMTAQRLHCLRSTMIYRADDSTETALLKVQHDIQGWSQHRDCTAQGPPWYTGLITAQILHCSRSTMIYRADDSTETALLKVHHDIQGWWQHRDCTVQGPPWYTGLIAAERLHCSRSTMIYRADDSTETALLKVHHDIQGWWQHRDCTAQGPRWYTGLMTAQRLHCPRSTMIYRADESTATALLKVHHDIQGWWQHRDCTAQGPPWYTGLMTAHILHCSRSTMIYRADHSTDTALLKVHHDIQGWWQHRDCTAQCPPWYTGLITAQILHCSRSTMIYRADDSTETALHKVHHDIQGWWQHRDCTAQGPPWYAGLITAQRRHCSRSTMIYRADDSTESALLKVHHDIQGWWQHRDCTAQGPPWYTGLMTAQRLHYSRSTMIYRADDSTETALLKVHHDIQGWWQHRDCTAQGPPWYTGLMTAQRLHCPRSTMIYRADRSRETALLKVHHDIQGWWQHRDCTAQGPPWYTGLMTAQRLHCSRSTMVYRADDSTETALLKVHHGIQGWWQHRDCTAQGPPWYTGLMRAQRLHCSRSTVIYRADDSTETALLKVHHDIQGW